MEGYDNMDMNSRQVSTDVDNDHHWTHTVAEIEEGHDRLILKHTRVRSIFSISFVLDQYVSKKNVAKILASAGVTNEPREIFFERVMLQPHPIKRCFVYFLAPLDPEWVRMFDMQKENKNCRVIISTRLDHGKEFQMFENNLPFCEMWTRNQCDNTEDKLHRMNSELIDIQNTLTKYQDTKKVDDIKNEAISDMVNALVKTTGRMNERIQEMIEVLYK